MCSCLHCQSKRLEFKMIIIKENNIYSKLVIIYTVGNTVCIICITMIGSITVIVTTVIIKKEENNKRKICVTSCLSVYGRHKDCGSLCLS